MTITENWRARAAQLADAIEHAGVPRSAAWRGAVTAVPRHALVPEFYEQHRGQWHKVSGDREPNRLLDAAYSPKTLVTQVTDRQPTSSSTTPTLMLHWLDVQDGHKVLEVGIGTGYNAALLSARLGDEHVFSVDVEPELVELARRRLAEIGYQPTLKTGNGAKGLPEHAQFDRIIATCSVPRIPTAWFEQLRPGGLLLADVKVGQNAGNLVLLRSFPDRLEGHFVDRWGGFMSLRHRSAATETNSRPRRSPGDVRESTTTITGTPWFDDLIPWFLVHLEGAVHGGATFGLDVAPSHGEPTMTNLVDIDGSWCEVDLNSDTRRVRQGGDRNLWESIEAAYAKWAALGHPQWERFGLTVSASEQPVWIDQPAKVIGTL